MSELLETLKAKYPTFKVQSEPSSTCPICKGKGEYTSRAGPIRVCLCVCISGDDEIRNIAADALHRKVPKSLRGES